jgi:hypothetical protein
MFDTNLQLFKNGLENFITLTTLMHVTQISCTFEHNHKMNVDLSKIQDGSMNSPCTLSRVVLPIQSILAHPLSSLPSFVILENPHHSACISS